jgi:hypothetical protein
VKILVAGLQRSGTNFLKDLLVQNCETPLEELEDEINSWKHAYPEDIYIPTGTKLFYIKKRPHNWLYSIDKQPEDIHHRFKETNSEEGLVLHYKNHSLAWAQFIQKRKVFYTEYETLIKNPKFVVERAFKFYGLKMKEVFIRPIKVKFSESYDPKVHDKMYINSEVTLKKPYIKMINKHLGWFL